MDVSMVTRSGTALSTWKIRRLATSNVGVFSCQSAVKFFKGLVCRFGVPNRVITDNGTQFTSHTFMQYIQDLGSKVCFASVAHPRSNGQAKRENSEVLRGLRTKTFDRLHQSGRRWIDELSAVIWSIKMTPN